MAKRKAEEATDAAPSQARRKPASSSNDASTKLAYALLPNPKSSCISSTGSDETSTGELDSSKGHIEAALALMERVYIDLDGYGLARAEKSAQRSGGVYLDGIQYGETQPRSFAQALEWLKPERGDIFYDLGSGTGIAVLTAAALYTFRGAFGIEILEPLHTAAQVGRDRR